MTATASKEEHRPMRDTLPAPQTSLEIMVTAIELMYSRFISRGSGTTPASPPGTSGVPDNHRRAGPLALTQVSLKCYYSAGGLRMWRSTKTIKGPYTSAVSSRIGRIKLQTYELTHVRYSSISWGGDATGNALDMTQLVSLLSGGPVARI